MKKYLLTFIAVVFATAMMAQDKNVFQGKFKNEELKISLNINFQEKNVKVPGQEIFGDVEGYMDSSQWEGIIHIPFADFLKKGFAK